MRPNVALVNYGVGNLFSVAQALEHCGAKVTLTANPAEIKSADKVVVPGVGAFGAGIAALRERGLEEVITSVAGSGKPLLGICLGMQLLFEKSVELGEHIGLKLLKGSVIPIASEKNAEEHRRVPHLGWNSLVPPPGSSVWGGALQGLPSDLSVYFVHSFHAHPADAGDVRAYCDYEGLLIPAVVQKNNILGCQFHPEKSGPTGLSILSHWING